MKGQVRKIKINVTISRILYTSDKQSAYGAFLNGGEDCEKIILHPIFHNLTLISKNSGLQLGCEYEVEVEEIFDKKHGRQYFVVSIPMFDEVDFSNLTYDESFNLLRSCTSEKLATELLRVYPDCINLIVNNKIDQIDVNNLKGIKETRLAQIERNLKASCKWVMIQQHCEEYGLNDQECDTLERLYNDKETIKQMLVEHPYNTLIDQCKREFTSVDKLALKINPEFRDTDERREFAYQWILKLNELEGSTKMNANIMGMCVQDYDKILTNNMKKIITNCPRFYYDNKTKSVALSETYEKELFIYDFIKERLQPKFDDKLPFEQFKIVDGFELTDEQLKALENGSKYGVSIIIGGAGTGKTSAFKGLINMIENCNKSYCIVAPTGKASLRVTELTNRPASTIHRKVLKDGGSNADYILIDESSMVDLDTMYMLLNAIENPFSKLIVCGDNGQLPPVGKGNIFHDMIRSEVVPIAKLTKVFRYNDKGIAYVATNINEQKIFMTEPKTHVLSDKYKFIQTNDCVNVLLEEYSKLLCEGIKPIDIMCLSPVKKGVDGVFNLNKEIQRMVNPLKDNGKHISVEIEKTQMDFRVKDVVVCKKNYYDIPFYDNYLSCKENEELMLEDFPTTEVYNGQTGIVRDINNDGLVIQFGNEVVFFNKPKVYTLLLGYVITRHSSQGSECPYVISVTSKNNKGKYMTKQSCYVSSTRSSNLHIEIGDIETLNEAILIDSNDLRETYLYDMLKGE